MRLKLYQFKTISLIGVCVLLIEGMLLFGVLRFLVWSQIDFMSKAEITTSSLGMMAHLPRFLVISPAYFVSETIGKELNDVYEWYILLTTSLTSLLWVKSRALLVRPKERFSLVYALPYLLLFVVGGRFVFGLFGLSMLLYFTISHAHSGLTISKGLGMFAGLFYCSVSSGVFVVGLLFLVLTFINTNRIKVGRERVVGWVGLAILLLPAISLTTVFVVRNLIYFEEEGHGVFGIISHGLGMVLNPEPVVAACADVNASGMVCSAASLVVEIGIFFPALLVMSLMACAIVLMKGLHFPRLAMRGLMLSLLGGVFGLTTLMSFIFILPICVNKKYLMRADL